MYREIFQDMQPQHDPRHIEAWIRTDHPTLDGLSWNDLKRLSNDAAEMVSADPDMSERLAATFGL